VVLGGKTDIQDVLVMFPVRLLCDTCKLAGLTGFTAHSYQYTFEPNPHWSEFYASSTEIQAYLARVVEKYGVARFVKTSHKVIRCTWNESAKKWYGLDSY